MISCRYTFAVDISSDNIIIFRDKNHPVWSRLSPDKTLEECGYKGQSWFNPVEQTLYYDYALMGDDCPLMQADYYFTGHRSRKYNA